MSIMNGANDLGPARVPRRPLRELRLLRINPTSEPSCAVFEEGRVAGCPHAKECALRGFGTRELLGFGPPSTEPGTGGEGPLPVGVWWKDGMTGQERMDYMDCHTYMAGLHPRRLQQEKTGDRIEVLGGPGTTIVQRYWMPVEENGKANKSNDVRMQEVVREVVVPGRSEHATVSAQQEYAEKMVELRRRAIRRMEEERDGGSATEALGAVTAAPVPVAAIAPAAPVKPAGKAVAAARKVDAPPPA